MQPIDNSRRPLVRRSPPRPPVAADGAAYAHAALPPEAAAPSSLRLAAPALFIEARFRELTLAGRLLRADEPAAFVVGAAAGVDAPVNPAWLPEPVALGDDAGGARRHALVEPAEGGVGFALNLGPAMRAELITSVQRLALTPDHGRAEAPLALPPDACLRVPCGEVVFEITAAEPAATVPRPWVPARWRDGARYPLAVALALLVLIAVARLVPSDPRALSLDDLGRDHRFTGMVTVPIDLTTMDLQKTLGLKAPGGAGAPAAAKPAGEAGSKNAPRVDRRMAFKGNAITPTTAQQAAAQIRNAGILPFLDAGRTGAMAELLSDRPAMGSDLADAMGHLDGVALGDAYGVGGLSSIGTGSGGGGTHEGTIGVGGLGTIGRFGQGTGAGPGYGTGAGRLGPRRAGTPEILPGIANVRGSLDKEIIRRIVRRHMNEIRYCYEQSLTTHPHLQGRTVVQFTISGTGQVLASVLQSSTMGVVAVDSCVVNAVKRWDFPAPNGGGVVIVSYPFQFTPAGG
jgi:TonB family protein